MSADPGSVAVALAAGGVTQRVGVLGDEGEPAGANVFGARVEIERDKDLASLVRRCAAAAAEGERVALVARASDLAGVRRELARVASRRVSLVVHATVEGPAAGEPASEYGLGPALALGELPWGVLVAAGAVEATDLALVAHRAAEDSGCPFFVVHDRSHGASVGGLALPSGEKCEAFLGGQRPPARAPTGDERSIAARVPFALGSALRDVEAVTGRPHDTIERVPGAEGSGALLGLGAIGGALLEAVARPGSSRRDVSALRVVAWRPFPGPKLVKALCRSLAVAVVEGVDRPLASGGPLSTELKAAFADALTWAPDYPGIGRIPRILSGIVTLVGTDRGPLDSARIDAIVEHLHAGERGERTFLVGGDHGTAELHSRPQEGGRGALSG